MDATGIVSFSSLKSADHDKMQTQLERAISEIRDKGLSPHVVDFTQHRLEDGTTISTQERVIKDVRPLPPSSRTWPD